MRHIFFRFFFIFNVDFHIFSLICNHFSFLILFTFLSDKSHDVSTNCATSFGVNAMKVSERLSQKHILFLSCDRFVTLQYFKTQSLLSFKFSFISYKLHLGLSKHKKTKFICKKTFFLYIQKVQNIPIFQNPTKFTLTNFKLGKFFETIIPTYQLRRRNKCTKNPITRLLLLACLGNKIDIGGTFLFKLALLDSDFLTMLVAFTFQLRL